MIALIFRENPQNGLEIRSSGARWVMLFLYGLLSITNAVIWITFAPIASLSATYYSTSVSNINILALTFMMAYLPGSLLAAWVFNKHGLGVGSVMQFQLFFFIIAHAS
jgi:FLVCR family MFS transporter 7